MFVLSWERTKRSIRHVDFSKKYPKIETEQNTVIYDSRKRRPVTFSVSNRLLRKCSAILLLLLCDFWLFIIIPSSHSSTIW